MPQVYIQCNGFKQLAKISSFLLAYPIDVKYSAVSIKQTMSNTPKKYEIYLLSFPHADPIGFWEFLMDYAPIPDRFVSCDDPMFDHESSENTMIDHTGYGDLFIEHLIHNLNS